MPTGLKITIIFNCCAVALLASVLFGFDANQSGKPVKAATAAIAALPAPSTSAPATPVIAAAQPAPDVMQMVRDNADRDRMAEPWVTLSDGSVRLRD